MDGLHLIEHFRDHVGKTFRIEGADVSLALDRVDVPNAPPRPEALRSPFTLIFRHEGGSEVLREGFYRCWSDGVEPFGMHIAPIHTPQAGLQEYQAAFN